MFDGGILTGGLIGAGIGGLQNWLGGQAKEKEEKKEAMRELYNRYLNHGNMMQIGKAPAQGPSMEESFGMPVLNAGINAFTQPKRKEGEKAPDWYEQAAKGYLGAVR